MSRNCVNPQVGMEFCFVLGFFSIEIFLKKENKFNETKITKKSHNLYYKLANIFFTISDKGFDDQ